ncbi:hypothetical protein [Pontibacter virosus]|uniref:Phage-Barnase-EndoU-ColicinE5/D-RelE like nuclease 2 domain-containing protein n=1 Tax=Pontibacter virosus TaxID=1765052 RepID=A0A2U1AVE5_9BACT|nr:hypothetical protein [Pontibacter virosus]PVY40372.1 hypothetical protein C8E01_1071 [Pontibacter virosus]
MATNLLKVYNALLEIDHLDDRAKTESLTRVFKRDFASEPGLFFRKRSVEPTPGEEDKLQRLLRHFTTVVADHKTMKREYEAERSKRLHWIKVHIEETTKADAVVFSSQDKDGVRTYLLNKDEKYVVVLEPLRKNSAYYILSAYRLGADSYRKMMNKYKRKLDYIA